MRVALCCAVFVGLGVAGALRGAAQLAWVARQADGAVARPAMSGADLAAARQDVARLAAEYAAGAARLGAAAAADRDHRAALAASGNRLAAATSRLLALLPAGRRHRMRTGEAVVAHALDVAMLRLRAAAWQGLGDSAEGAPGFTAALSGARLAVGRAQRFGGPALRPAARLVAAALDDYAAAFNRCVAGMAATGGFIPRQVPDLAADLDRRLAVAQAVPDAPVPDVAAAAARCAASGQLRVAGLVLLLGAAWAAWAWRIIMAPIRSAAALIRQSMRDDANTLGRGADRAGDLGVFARAAAVLRLQAEAAECARSAIARLQAAQAAAEADGARGRQAQRAALEGIAGALAETEAALRRSVATARAAPAPGGAAAPADAVLVALTGGIDSAERLGAAMRDSAAQAAQIAATMRAAARHAQAADDHVSGLAEAAEQVREVVGLIGSVAKQTNLLALNATIEAVRAGEAGRGFAVVAGEVKALATQTGAATGRITRQIGAIQGGARNAVVAVRDLSGAVGELGAMAAAIAAAVEQQLAAVGHIASLVRDAGAAWRAAACAGRGAPVPRAEVPVGVALRAAEECARLAGMVRGQIDGRDGEMGLREVRRAA